ncbi:MAG: hypothetical protein P4L51_10400 [Puia sp.]|nr:hypothetical protein [Puia sp.]
MKHFADLEFSMLEFAALLSGNDFKYFEQSKSETGFSGIGINGFEPTISGL